MSRSVGGKPQISVAAAPAAAGGGQQGGSTTIAGTGGSMRASSVFNTGAAFPSFHVLDRLYADMMDSVDRVRSEMDRLYNPPFGAMMNTPFAALPGVGMTPSGGGNRSGMHPLALSHGNRSTGGSMMPYRGMPSAWDMLPDMYGGSSIMPYTRGSNTMVPRVDFRDCGNEYLLQADVPGIEKNNVKIQVQNGVLHLSGEQQQEAKEEQQGYFMQERYQTAFSRSIPLPENVKEDDIRANMKDGVLQIHLPKNPSEKPDVRKIHVE